MKPQKVTQVHHTSDQDLTTIILNGVEQKLNTFKENFQPKEPTIWITRKQVGEILSISLVTVDQWTNKSILSAYRIGNKKRFKRHEVESALTKIGK